MPLALNSLDQPLAPLGEKPKTFTLSGLLPKTTKPSHLIDAACYERFLQAWRVAIDAGIVPAGPFNPALCRCYEAITLSGGDHRSIGVTLRRGSACEVAWSGDDDVWQMQPAPDSDSDSEGIDIDVTDMLAVDGDDDTAGRGAARQTRRKPGSRRGGHPQAATASAAMPPLRTKKKRGGARRRRLLPEDEESVAGAAAPASAARARSKSADSGASTARRKPTRQSCVSQFSARGRGGRPQVMCSASAAPDQRSDSVTLRRGSRVRLQTYYEFDETSIDSGDISATCDGRLSHDSASSCSDIESAEGPARSRSDGHTRKQRTRKRGRQSKTVSQISHPCGDTDEEKSSSGSSASANTIRHVGGDPSSSDEEDRRSTRSAAEPAAAAPAAVPPTRASLKAASADRRSRRRMSCDPVVRLQIFFEYHAPPVPHTGHPVSHKLVFAYYYRAVTELDAFMELGSRDFTVRECTAGGATILPATELVCPRRREPVPTGQLPHDWPDVQRRPDYIWIH